MRNRRVEVLLPEEWVQELDDVARLENKNRSGIIREATRQYLADRRKEELRRQLRYGYQAMGPLNLELAAEVGFDAPGDAADTLE